MLLLDRRAAPESQEPAYISGEFHQRNHPALSFQITSKSVQKGRLKKRGFIYHCTWEGVEKKSGVEYAKIYGGC